MGSFKKHILCLFVMIALTINSFGQDPTFSQFYANRLYLAPSFAGAVEDYRLAFNYRNQWPAIPGVFNTFSFSFDKAMPRYNSGIGIMATHDIAGSGELSTSTVGAVYSYDIKINDDWHIRPGANFKMYYLGLDLNKLIFNNQIGAGGTPPVVIPPTIDNRMDIDFATSALAYNDRMWYGLTVDHLLTPSVSFFGDNSTVPIKFNAFGGIQLMKKERLKSNKQQSFSLAFNFQKQQDFYQIDVGSYYKIDPLIFGLWYRGIPGNTPTPQAGDAVIAMVGIKTNNLHIGYSYDFTISGLGLATGGSHEVSFIYTFNSLGIEGKQRIRALPCPEF